MPIKITREEYERKFGVAPGSTPPPAPEKKSLPTLTSPTGGLGTALKDVAVGAGKSLIGGARGTTQLIEGLGKTFMRSLGGDTSGYGVRSLDESTPEGAGVSETLKAKSQGEMVGKTLGTVGEIASGFVAAKGPQAVSRGVQTYKAGKEAKATEKALESVTPRVTDFSPNDYEDMLRLGRISPKTAKEPAKYVLTGAEREVALRNRHLIDKDPVKTSINLMKDISRKDAEVGDFLRKNNAIFSNGELRNHILQSLDEVDDISIPEERIAKLKTTLTDGFIRALGKNDMESLWTARKAFDRSIERVFSGSPTLQNRVKREMRNSVQEFIMQRTPDDVYGGKMREMRELFDLFDTVSTKATKERGRSKIQEWVKKNPGKAKAIGWGTGGIVGNEILKATTGFGI